MEKAPTDAGASAAERRRVWGKSQRLLGWSSRAITAWRWHCAGHELDLQRQDDSLLLPSQYVLTINVVDGGHRAIKVLRDENTRFRL